MSEGPPPRRPSKAQRSAEFKPGTQSARSTLMHFIKQDSAAQLAALGRDSEHEIYPPTSFNTRTGNKRMDTSMRQHGSDRQGHARAHELGSKHPRAPPSGFRQRNQRHSKVTQDPRCRNHYAEFNDHSQIGSRPSRLRRGVAQTWSPFFCFLFQWGQSPLVQHMCVRPWCFYTKAT